LLLVTFSDSTGYALSGPTNERRYRSDVWGAILAMSKGTHDSRFAVHHPLRLMAAAFARNFLNLTKREICEGNNSQSVNVADCLSKVRNGQTIYLSPFGDRQNFSVMVGHALGCPPTVCQRAVTLGHEDMGPGDRRGLGSALQDSPRGRGTCFVRINHSTVNLDLLQNRAGFEAPDDLANDRRFSPAGFRVVYQGGPRRADHCGRARQKGARCLDSHWYAPNQEEPGLAFSESRGDLLYRFHSGIFREPLANVVERLIRDVHPCAKFLDLFEVRLREPVFNKFEVTHGGILFHIRYGCQTHSE
jgi:hypothetical protein